MVFVAGGFGGGTGTGAGPIVAKIAKEMGALTIGVVTKPFMFEGQRRMRLAEEALAELSKSVDALIVVPNDKLMGAISKDTTAKDAFAMSDEVLKQAVEGISELITTPGNVGNIDFADIRAVLENAGSALMGIGTGTGDNRAVDAAKTAISSPLIDVSIHGAKGVLFSIAGSDDLTMFEISEAARVITESVDPDAKIIFGTVKDEKLKKNEVRITVVAANFPDKLTAVRNIFRDRETMVQESVSSQDESNKSGKIFNSITINKKDEEEDTEDASNIMRPAADTDEDDWSAVPAFLRRAKNR
jgi:cell division protein FtsZ